MSAHPISVLRLIAPLFLALLLSLPAIAAQAECSGCLCPGNPCKLCALPPTENIPPAPDEAETCLKIRENVAPVSKNTEPSKHYASLNNSMRECVKNGGDVIVNSRRNNEFPSKHYCKPYISPANANIRDGAHSQQKDERSGN
ncbi:hypothetical protein [Nitrosospira sp. Nl5]|uniref:hypothetical protein n=1 Tax=Nitrosospira sp. Nl5 TaxID=200120 RepID=UPI0015A40D80|nr:hypothetical protein [Nitrosospira sp. Nl5]